ncbi:MAG: dodecin domain-containing protein [Candidatus Heimdallarchaeota archaeon]|nr:dodecin domain-containing protein [Candidatus Heimdallarchaeota archaeon]
MIHYYPIMPSSYKVVTVIGTSEISWEEAVKNVVKDASKTIRDIRRVEVETLDAKISDREVVMFRAKVKLSFKLQTE